MKKAFCFSLIVMIIALASSPILVKADDVVVVTPFVDSPTLTNQQIDNLTNTSLLIEYLRNGGTIDVSNTSDDYDVYDLLSDFGNFVKDIVDVGLDFINPFQTEVQYHGLQPIRLATPAIWNLLGLLPFYALNSEPQEEPQLPNDYSFLSNINKLLVSPTTGVSVDFFDMPYYQVISANSTNVFSAESFRNNSFYFSGNISNNHVLQSTSQIPATVVCSPFINIYVDTISDELVHVAYSNYTYKNFPFDSSNTYYANRSSFFYENETYNSFTFRSYNNNTPSLSTSFQDLNTAINYLYNHFFNVNIYVNNIPWVLGNSNMTPNIQISTGTVVPIDTPPVDDPTYNSGKVRWEYDTYIYYDIDLIEQELSLLLDEIRNLQHPTIIRYNDIEDVIVDVDGQPAVSVKVLEDPRNIDEIYLSNYGPIIPAFIPLFTPVINDSDIYNIASTAVSPIPEDLLEVFGYMFMGVLFIGFIHRLLE